MALLLLLGLLANLTVIGSAEPLGMVPFNSWIALSASKRWSNRMNPTPFDNPVYRYVLISYHKFCDQKFNYAYNGFYFKLCL